MLTVGNRKLGRHLIWSFSLPTVATCPGASPICLAHCYARAFERYRPAAAERYRRNLSLSHRRDFARRVRAFLIAQDVRVVRIHVGGDFDSADYAAKWLEVIGRAPRTRFFFYTRSWRIPDIKAVIDDMAILPNCRAWYSFDVDTGVPTDIPADVRLAWLQTTTNDPPPATADLVFRVRRLQHRPPDAGATTCPAEVGSPSRMTCERCGYCWRPRPTGRIPLPVIPAPTENHDTD